MKHSSPDTVEYSHAAAGLTATDYVRLLHPSESRGKVSFVLIRSRDDFVTRTYSTKTAPIIVNALLDESAYVSMNRFNGPRRGDRLAQLNALYLDLDVHRLVGGLRGAKSAEDWAALLQNDLDEKGLPQPSIITSTGRGLAAIWLLKPLPAKALPRWRQALRALIQLFQHLGADSSCSDSSRVFRLPGTMNLKAGKEVRTIGGTLRRYGFDELSDRIFMAAGRPTRAQLADRKRDVAQTAPRGDARGLTPRQRFKAIMRDLERILDHWGGTIPEGRRNSFLHIAATCLTHKDQVSDIDFTVSRLAQRAAPGLSDKEVAGIIRSAERQVEKACSSVPSLDGRLHYSGTTIAERLEISDELAQHLELEQVFSGKERARRKAEKAKARRRSEGADSRSAWLAENSISREKPWELAGMSRTTWYRKGLHKSSIAM